jgi:hypothetical protein
VQGHYKNNVRLGVGVVCVPDARQKGEGVSQPNNPMPAGLYFLMLRLEN